ncbi:MAG TPA: PQQ-binding-like beta-propeller repeat protein [Blastocatellia bacterium]|nr:PQQ-binding-like beta-propeller repeat protein [Blastocatellia bacterium]HMV86096.1 PQQ-binding-like beta-propeller repeat protein [Blastocatellia bacterium]HMY76635.1 PQQ-binding-like beta-propeller repeat protein [Blastocatellia bacterium]HMZ22717.1 PQQ-binding-like beta-propeller repeat protein [Blastocatellia bacterium]HNG31697.1 PQQ-binding-like beta-propeller repeat protein [Blastocatellia bacterium]
MMKKIIPLLLLLLFSLAAQAADDWPQFRGPEGTGHSDARDLPQEWSETKNIVWKTAIHDRGWSSPVVYGKQVWLTSASPDGRKLYALCLDRDTGKVIRDIKLFEVEKPQYAHPFNTYASPTPVIEKGRVYITFGSPGTACIDTATFKVLWERRDFECNHFRGSGSSPVIFRDLLLMHFDGSDYQFVVALDKRTGKTVWRTNRSIDFQDLDKNGKPMAEGDLRKAFSTPQVAQINGRWEFISLGAKAAYSYDPFTGKELWRVEERAQHSASTRPVLGHGMIFYPTGFSAGQLFAVRTGGNGLITDTHVVWKVKRGVSNKPSILLIGDLIYMIGDTGIASCIDAKTGEQVWQQRIGGEYSASPVYADGKIWLFSEDGKTTVIKPSRTFELLAENRLDEGFLASPAIAGKAFFLRTRTHLYRIEKK